MEIKKEGDTISNIYQGGYSSLDPDPDSNFIGYNVKASELGAPTKPDTANQIQHVTNLLNQGIVPIEVGALDPKVFDQIPKQHFKEIKRLAKLSDAKISLHAPIIEPSGIGEQGWSESNRELAERQLKDAVDRAVEMSDEGGMPITIHSAGIPGTEYKFIEKDGKRIKVPEKLIVINQESGKMMPIEEEERGYPGFSEKELVKGKTYDPKKEFKLLNRSEWDNSVSNAIFYKDNADKIIEEVGPAVAPILMQEAQGKLDPSKLGPKTQALISRFNTAGKYLEHTDMTLNSLFNKAWKYGTPEDHEKLKTANKEYRKTLGFPEQGAASEEQQMKAMSPEARSRAQQVLINHLSRIVPELYKPVEEFAKDKSAETFANVAFHAFKQHKKDKRVPQINIENLYPGMAFASGKEMNELITTARNKFVDKAKKEGISESQAKQKAEEVIGMTLDVGHLNIHKKQGYKDKDLLKEVAEIAKHVKHVHLTDNFGYSDSHLPPGMGNVPMKDILKHLEKEGFEGRKIVEAGGFVQHFGTSPLPYVLEGMGSPMYESGMAPYWNQNRGLIQGYYEGFGMMLPQKHYQTFGAGFSQLPRELGGQVQGAGGKFSQTPME